MSPEPFDRIEDLAETHGPEAALAVLNDHALAETPAGQLLRGALLARAGDLDGALVVLTRLVGASEAGPAIRLEAEVTLASVWAARGDYDQAVPRLRQAIRRLRSEGGPAWLLADAEAELAAYETLSGR